MHTNTKTIAVLIYNGVELVDMNGPIDAFLHVNSFKPNRYAIYTIAETSAPVKSEGGVVTIIPDFTFDSHPEPDLIVIPGLLDAQLSPTTADDAVVAWIKKMVQADKIILSVCVGLYNLAATGLLGGRRVTTHYLAIDYVHEKYKDLIVVKNVRFVVDGKFVTTAGITSGIDGALHLVETFDGPDAAQQVADIMVYNRAAPLPPYTILPPYYMGG